MSRAVVLGALAALALGLAACSSTESPTEAAEEYCAAVASLQAEVLNLSDLVSSDATVDELRAQREAVSAAADAVDAQAVDVDDAIDASLDEAQETFEAAIEAIPGDATASEAAQAYNAAATEYNEAVVEVLRDLGC